MSRRSSTLTPCQISLQRGCGLALFALLSASASAQITATYTGPNNDFWDNPANWNIGQVPINNGPSTFNAIIPNSITVNFDVFGDSEISGFSLGSNARLNLFGGSKLETLGFTVIDGLVDVRGEDSAFLAHSALTNFELNGLGRAHARDGALNSILAPTYTGDFGSNSADVFIAEGPGSLLDLSSLKSLSILGSGSSSSRTFRVAASNNATIDLSAVTSIQGAGGNNFAEFHVANGGEIKLDSTETITGRTRFIVGSPTLELPSLKSVSGGHVFRVGVFNNLKMAELTSMDNTTLEIETGGTIEAPKLTTFTSGYIEYAPGRLLLAPEFTNFDQTRLQIRGGAEFSVAASSYTADFGSNSASVFIAADPGSVLDLSSLTTISILGSGSSSARTFRVTASNNATIDLSGVTSIQGAGGNNWTHFESVDGGEIMLDELLDTSGRVSFLSELPHFELPKLGNISGPSRFIVESGGTFSLPQIEMLSNATFDVAAGSKMLLPMLTTLTGGSLNISNDGTFEAPKLTAFRSAFLELRPETKLLTPAFTEINQSRFAVRGGAAFSVAAPSYTGDFGGDSTDVFLATDSGSLLDLSTLSSLAVLGSGSSSSRAFRVTASNSATIDLSGVTSIQGAGGNNWAQFRVAAGGQMQFGNVAFSTGRSQIQAQDSSSRMDFAGSVEFLTPTQVSLQDRATMAVAGSLSFNQTNEAHLRLDRGIVHMNGTSLQRLEVGGADLGLPAGSIDPNFHIGQLVIGESSQATEVELVDWVNNGNRGPNEEREVLYLQGFTGADGLRILGGSTLYLNYLTAYAMIDEEWTHLNDLFPGGVTEIQFDEGYLNIGPGPCEPPPHCPVDWNCDGEVDILDFFAFLDDFAAGNSRADINKDGEIDINDFFTFLALYEAGC